MLIARDISNTIAIAVNNATSILGTITLPKKRIAKGSWFKIQALVLQNLPKDTGAFSSTTAIELKINGTILFAAAIQDMVEAKIPGPVVINCNSTFIHGNDGKVYQVAYPGGSATTTSENLATQFLDYFGDFGVGDPSVVDPTQVGLIDVTTTFNPANVNVITANAHWDATGGDAGFINTLLGFSLWSFQPLAGNATTY